VGYFLFRRHNLKIKTVKDADFNGKKVLLRVDFNVPVVDGKITDDTRIKRALPTINYILDHGAKLITMIHFGNPKPENKDDFKVDIIAKKYSELINRPVKKLDDCIGPVVEKAVDEMNTGDVILLENVRFYKEEKKNDPEFAKKLASIADIYVNDAFGAAHRAHASTRGVADYLPSYAGFLMEKEIIALGSALYNPERPFAAILGGAKVSGKLPLIENLLPKVDKIFIGGGMVFTFLKAMGKKIGNSLLEEDYLEKAKEILRDHSEKLVFPVDYIYAEKFDENSKPYIGYEIPDGFLGLDIGPESITKFEKELSGIKTVVWNGPMGVFEMKPFSKGTFDVAEFLSKMNAKVIIGGGDSASAVKKAGLEDSFYHVSTGGGASMEFLEGKMLPGIEKLLYEEEKNA